MNDPRFHLAQVDPGHLRAPLDAPEMSGFVERERFDPSGTPRPPHS
ncbi:hypothetical protein [Nocardiopsis alkaliphila]|nr:hypothetical protein [Nocardiopsis alkaliphila]